MIRSILKMGNPKLRIPSRELSRDEVLSHSFKTLIRDMVETMHEAQGVGLAAPQIGENVRVCVIEFEEEENGRYPQIGSQGLTVFVNPKVEVLDSAEQSFWEGCLSVPDLRGLVSRPRKVRVTYWNEKAEPCEVIAEGFLAIVVQHEFDHLDGVLYIDRVKDTTKLAYLDEYREFILPDSEHDELD